MTWHYQDRAGVPRTHTVYAERRTRSIPFLRWIGARWNHRRLRAKALRPRVTRTGRIAHLAFWTCVHGGEGNSHPSAGHPYSGPLQMTSYWAGYSVYDWMTVPVSVVYADAEAQLQIHLRRGDAYSWVAGQWPNTSGRCLGYL